ncbi:hypothetical protein Tco_1146884 [Tanacetum coccineum]
MLVMTAVGGVGGSEVVVPRWGWRLFGGGDVGGVVGEGDERDGGEGGGRLAEDRPKVGRKVRGGEEEDMWRLEYMKYEVEIKRDPWGYAQTYTRSSGSTTLEKSKENKHHPDKLKTNAYFPLFSPCFKLTQPLTKDTHEPVGEDPNDFNLSARNSHHEDEEVSSDEDVDEWFNAKIGKRMTGQDKEEDEDVLIDILKTVLCSGKQKFNPLEIENDIFSYDSPACLLLERGTPSCSEESIDTVDSSHDMQELEGLRTMPYCNPDFKLFSGYDAIYGQRRKEVRYENKNIDDVTREQRYYEWVVQNYDFTVKSRRDTETRDDPYSRRFDVYKEEFDNEIEQLKNEYELKAKRKRYALDEVWEKCEKFHDTTKLWYDKGFEEKELWQNGIEEIDYTHPLVKSETFEVHRYTFKI